MRQIYQKRIAILCAVILIILGLIPAFCPTENETLKKDCHFSKTFDQLFTGLNPIADLYAPLNWSKAAVAVETLQSLPIVLSSIPETRAPPA